MMFAAIDAVTNLFNNTSNEGRKADAPENVPKHLTPKKPK